MGGLGPRCPQIPGALDSAERTHDPGSSLRATSLKCLLSQVLRFGDWGGVREPGDPGSASSSLYTPSTTREKGAEAQSGAPGRSPDGKGGEGALTPVLFFLKRGSPHLQGASRCREGRRAGFSQEPEEAVNKSLLNLDGTPVFSKTCPESFRKIKDVHHLSFYLPFGVA